MKERQYILAFSLAVFLILLMIAGMFIIIVVNARSHFWPDPLLSITLKNQQKYLGQIVENRYASISAPQAKQARSKILRVKVGNRDVYRMNFIWVSGDSISSVARPSDAVSIERYENGIFFGAIRNLTIERKVFEFEHPDFSRELVYQIGESRRQRSVLQKTREQLNRITSPLVQAQKEFSGLPEEENGEMPGESEKNAVFQEQLQRRNLDIQTRSQPFLAVLDSLSRLQQERYLQVITIDGIERTIRLADIARLSFPNRMNILDRSWYCLQKIWEFLAENPRQSNMAGGIFPAIFGTVLLVFLMTLAVAPAGVITALYLTQYAGNGWVVRGIRLIVHSLAGVPSIIFGMFGLGFFIYTVGGSLDQLVFSHNLPAPTVGTGGIFWAALTLALLTLPVVIISSEAGIRSVTDANRQGAYALGASKWQSIYRIILPQATPGILTGIILAISRAAGEVAPLLLTGVAKLAPALAVNGTFPYLHPERKFMHLGYHIYDLGFQSPDIESVKPLVFATALLLILIVITLNLLAMNFRHRLRKKYQMPVF